MKNGGKREVRTGMAIDMIALEDGSVAFRLREDPQEPIYVFSQSEARQFLSNFQSIVSAAELLAATQNNQFIQ